MNAEHEPPSTVKREKYRGEAVFEATVDLVHAPIDSKLADAASPDPEANLKRLGDYELLYEIARGGMGVVYKARQVSLNRVVALKMIRAGELAGDDEIRRFRVEAEAAARLDHPAIVPVYEVDELDGQHYYSMGFVNGQSLAQRLGEGPLPPRAAADLVRLIAEGVQYAHGQGVIHRDLKPANILLVETESAGSSVGLSVNRAAARSSVAEKASSTGQSAKPSAKRADVAYFPKITDFGLAKQVQTESDLTSTGQILGTPSYMPPEQAEGKSDIGPAADVYSLGAVLYAATTGRPPFQAANAIETVRQVIEREPVSPRRLNPALDRDLETICLKCLQKAPAKRYESAAALSEDLRRYLSGETIRARPVSGLTEFWRWAKRHPGAAASIGAIAIALLAALMIGLVSAQLRLSRQTAENRRLRVQSLEKEAQLREAELTSATQRAESQRQVADTQRYFALLTGVRERSARPQPGWTYAGLEELRQAIKLPIPSDGRVEIRSEAARCLTGADLHKRSIVAMDGGYRSHLVAAHPHADLAAAATLKHWVQLRVKVFEPSTGKVVRRLSVGSSLSWQVANRVQDAIDTLNFSADGEALFVTTRSGWLHRWDLREDPAPVASFELPQGPTTLLVPHPSDDLLLFAVGQTLYRWTPAKESSPTVVWKAPENIRGLAISPDGKRAALTYSGVLGIVDLGGGEATVEHPISAFGCRYSRDGRLLALQVENRLLLVDAASGLPIRTLQDADSESAHEGGLTQFEWSPSGSLIVTAGWDHCVRLWDVANGRLLVNDFIGGTDNVHPAFSADERFVIASGDMRATIYDLNGPALLPLLASQGQPIRAFELAGAAQAAATVAANVDGENDLASVWNCRSGALIDAWRPTEKGIHDELSLAFQNDGRRIAIAQRRRNHVALWDIDAKLAANAYRAPLKELAIEAPSAVAIDEHGAALWTAIEGDAVTSWTLPDLTARTRWSNRLTGDLVGRGAINCLATGTTWSAAGAASGFVALFRDRQSEPKDWTLGRFEPSCLALGQSETLIACGASEGAILIGSLSEARTIAELRGHADRITSLSFAPGDTLLASASRDETIRLWKLEGGVWAPVLTLYPPGVAETIRLSDDGSQLIALLRGETALRDWRLDEIRRRLAEMELDW